MKMLPKYLIARYPVQDLQRVEDDLDVHFWKHSYGHEEVDEIVLYRHSRRKTISTRK
jgi:hypothetical protein